MKWHEIPCILRVNVDENSMVLENRRFTLIGHPIWEKSSGVKKKNSRYIWKANIVSNIFKYFVWMNERKGQRWMILCQKLYRSTTDMTL